jgi:hypothetical protein
MAGHARHDLGAPAGVAWPTPFGPRVHLVVLTMERGPDRPTYSGTTLGPGAAEELRRESRLRWMWTLAER